jgi:hypothetical protein
MTLVERINYYAKGVGAAVGGFVTFCGILVTATNDGSVDTADLTTIITGALTFVGTVIYVIKKRNIDPNKEF